MVRPKGHPCQVRNDEPDKPDQSGKETRGRSAGRRAPGTSSSLFNVHAKLKSDLLTGGDEVKLFGKAEENEGSSDQRRSQNDERSIAALRKISVSQKAWCGGDCPPRWR